MKIQKENTIIIASLILSIVFSSYVWNLIKIPYQEVEIIGVYAENKYNPFNEILRYFFFILFPLLVFLILQIHFTKFEFKNLIPQLKITQDIAYDKSKVLKFIKIIILTFIFAEFFTAKFTLSPLDLFHEGQRLSSAYKSLIDNSLWSGSYVTVSIFYETLSAKFIWQIFNHESIGLMRFADRIFILLCKILIVLIIYRISLFTKLRFFYKEIFFSICSLILITKLFDYNTERNDAEYLLFRELPILLISYFFFEIISKKNFNKFIIFFIGILSFLSMMWSIDRGLISNILIISIFLYLIISDKYKDGLILISSVIFSWILGATLLGNEFNYFLDNTFSLLKDINHIFGEIHVSPFTSETDSFRASKILISIIFCLVISINFFIKNMKNFTTQYKLSMLFLAITSFLTYGYNLGRSGGVHLKEVYGYSIIFIVIVFFYFVIKFFAEKNFVKYQTLLQKKIFLIFFIIFTFIIFLDINIFKIVNFKNRFTNYIYLNDENFIHKNDQSFLNYAKTIVNNHHCVQMFSNEAAYLYLLRKKNCTKYYFVFSIGSHEMQNKMINELNNTEIIISTRFDDKGHPSYKLHLVRDFIEENYKKLFDENKKIVYKKIEK